MSIIEFFAIVGLLFTSTITVLFIFELGWRVPEKIKKRRKQNERFRAKCVCRDCCYYNEDVGRCILLEIDKATLIKNDLGYPNISTFFCKFGATK